jgi:hypothetical protein
MSETITRNETPRKEHKSFLVDVEALAYSIIDAGFLHCLNGVITSKRDGVTKLYFFDKDDTVADIIDTYKAKHNREYND